MYAHTHTCTQTMHNACCIVLGCFFVCLLFLHQSNKIAGMSDWYIADFVSSLCWSNLVNYWFTQTLILPMQKLETGPLCWKPRLMDGSLFTAWTWSEYNFACFTCCREFCLCNFDLSTSFFPPNPLPLHSGLCQQSVGLLQTIWWIVFLHCIFLWSFDWLECSLF